MLKRRGKQIYSFEKNTAELHRAALSLGAAAWSGRCATALLPVGLCGAPRPPPKKSAEHKPGAETAARGCGCSRGEAQPPPAWPPQGLLPALVAFFPLKPRNFQPGLGQEERHGAVTPSPLLLPVRTDRRAPGQTSVRRERCRRRPWHGSGPDQVPRAPLVLRAEPDSGRGAAPPPCPCPPGAVPSPNPRRLSPTAATSQG